MKEKGITKGTKEIRKSKVIRAKSQRTQEPMHRHPILLGKPRNIPEKPNPNGQISRKHY